MLALLLASLSSAESYPKTICACHTCNASQEDCIGAKTVDPLLTTFYEDFDTARENHRQILLYFNEMKPDQTFEFNLAAFTNLDIQFISYDYYSPVILMKYENSEDYSNSNMTFNRIKVQFDNMDINDNEYVLKLGHFTDKSNSDHPLEFIQHGDAEIKITAKTFMADLTSLKDCHSLTITNSIDHIFYITDRAEVKLTVDQDILSLIVGKANIIFNPKEIITFIGQNRGFHDNHEAKISATFGNINMNKNPKFIFKHLSTVSFHGAKPEGIIELIDCNNIITNGPIFPYTITADNFFISFSEDTAFTGIIRRSGFSGSVVPNISIGCEIKKRTTVKFPNVLTATVSVISPYLNVEIKSLNVSHYTRAMEEFPVVGAVSENEASQINIDDIDYGPKVGLITKFMIYTDISAQFSDTELKTKKIAKGLSFLTFPSRSFVEADYDAFISLYSISFYNKIHGFTTFVNNMKIDEKRESGKTVVSAIWNQNVSISDFTRYICIGSKCDVPSDELTAACYLNVTDPSEISNYSMPIIKKYYIHIENDMTSAIDLSQLKGTEIEVFIEGSSPKTLANFKGTSLTSIKKLILENLTVNTDFTFDVPELFFNEKISFNARKSIKYGTNTVLTMHASSYEQTYSIVHSALKKLIINASECLGFKPFTNQVALFYGKGEGDYYNIDVNSLSDANETIYYINTEFYVHFDDFDGLLEGVSITGGTIETVGPTTLTLRGNPLGFSSINPPMVLNNYHHTKLIYTLPHQGDKLTVINKSLISTSVKYSISAQICIFNEGGTDDCSATADYTINGTSNITEAIEKLPSRYRNMPSLDIWVSIGYKDDMVIHMSSFNEKFISIHPFPSYDDKNLEIVFDVKEISQEYSFLILSNIVLTTKNEGKIDVKFGAVELTSDAGFSKDFAENVTINFYNLKCYYSLLTNFEEIHITDQIQLSDDLSEVTDDVTVYIGLDNNANDIIATDLESCDIRVGKDYVKLGKITFNLPKSAFYDAYFEFSEDSDINVKMSCDEGVTFDHFPKLTLNTTAVASTELHLEGEWFGYDDNNIKLMTKAKTDIYIDDDMVPITIQGAENDVTFHFSSKIVGVFGPLYSSGGSYVFQSVESLSNEEINFEISQGMIIQTDSPNPTIRVRSTNINVLINGTISLDRDISHAKISFGNIIDNEKSSSIKINDYFGDGIELNPLIVIESLLTGKVDEEKLNLIKQNHTLISAKRLDFAKINSATISYYKDDSVVDRTHGFYWTMNCLNVDVIADPSIDDGFIVLYKEKLPSQVPFSIDIFNSKSDFIPTGELVITEKNYKDLEKLATFLPEKLTSIVLNIQSDMDPTHPFIIKKYISTLTEISVQGAQLTKPKGFITLPTEGDLILSFYNFILLSSEKGTSIQCKSLNLTNIEFNASNIFTITSKLVNEIITDVDSLGTMQASSIISGEFTNPVTITSCNFITFTKIGWEMRELYFFPPITVNPSVFSNLVANSSRTLELSIKEKGMKSIKGLKINANKMEGVKKVQIQFGRNWQDVTETNGLIIKVGSEEVDAGMSSNPVPYVFDTDKSKVSFFYNEDSNDDFDLVTMKETSLESASMTYNLTNLNQDHQILKVGDIEVSGNTSIKLVDNVGTAECNSVNVLSNSRMTFPNVSIKKSLTIHKVSSVLGQFSFGSDSELNLHWTLNSMPLLIFTPSTSSVPKLVKIILDDKKVNINEFNDQFYGTVNAALIKGEFNCPEMQKNIIFESDDNNFKSGANNVLLTSCQFENGKTALIMSASKKIESHLSTGAIIGIVIACVVVAIVISGIIIYCNMKKQYNTLLSSLPVELDDPSKTEIKYVS